MKAGQTKKKERQKALLKLVEKHPLLTDEELARRLGVSVQTIRLDRMVLRLPELKERSLRLASRFIGGEQTPAGREVVGEFLYCEPGVGGLSRLETGGEMRLSRYNVVRGHFLFAQANSLAVGVVKAAHALTASAKVDFLRPVSAGLVLLARARIVREEARKYWVQVETTAEGEKVFQGEFLVVEPEKVPEPPGESGETVGEK